MNTAVLAGLAALGVALVLADLWRSPGSGPAWKGWAHRAGAEMQGWMRRSGLEDTSPRQFVTISFVVGAGVSTVAGILLGPGVPALAIGIAAALVPTALWRRQHMAAVEAAAESWPGIIEEVRVRVGSIGRPIPQALVESGLAAPPEVRPAFVAAQREWALTTDFERTVAVLKDALRDPTADAVCETLLVIQEVGGDVDARLAALAEDRRTALRDTAEAEARQAGARLARWFVILVPLGMAFAGFNLGDGGNAYRSAGGQAATAVAIALIAACWVWAGRIMHLPVERRVFDR